MTNKEQDNLLLQDILTRNYFNNFKDKKNNKELNLTFFYNNQLTDYAFIPNYHSLENNNSKEKIYKNFSLLLNWYQKNKFFTTINIHDELLLKDIKFCIKIFNLIKKKNIKIKLLNLYINLSNYSNFDKIYNIIQQLKQFNINYIFNIGLNQINQFLNYDFSFIPYELNILIFPEIKNTILIQNQDLIKTQNLNIKNYIEVDSDKWTTSSIENYLIYLQHLLDNTKKIDEFFTVNSPIQLIDQHIIDNLKCKKNCNFQNSLNILLINLSINLCHNFQHEDLIIGYLNFDTKNNLSIEAKNLTQIILNTHLKRSSTPHCESCPFINLCSGFCFNSSYLKCLNPIIPIQESCQLKKAKFIFIFQYILKNYDINTFLIENNLISLSFKNYLEKILNQIRS